MLMEDEVGLVSSSNLSVENKGIGYLLHLCELVLTNVSLFC